jgi:hypothetical protein
VEIGSTHCTLNHVNRASGLAAVFTPPFGAREDELAPAVTTALLHTLTVHPALTRMCFLEALAAGPRIQHRRDAAIERFAEQLTPLPAGAGGVARPLAACASSLHRVRVLRR